MTARRDRRALFFWLSAGHWANDSGPGAVWIIAPAIAVAMNLSPAELGLLIAIHNVGASLAYFPAGILADRVANHGRLLLATFVWVALGYAAASLASGFWGIALLLAVAGLGDAAWHPIATGVLVKLQPERKAEALGIHAFGGTLAEVTAPLAMGFLLAVFDWRTALLFAAVPAAVMAVAFLRIVPRIPRAQGPRLSLDDLLTLMRHWRRPLGLGIVATISVYNMAFVAILAMMPLYLQSVHAFTPAETGIVFAITILFGALMQPVTGRLSDRIGRKPVVVFGNLAAAAAALCLWQFGDRLVVALLAIAVAVILLAAIRSSLLAVTIDYAKDRAATTLGLAFAVLDGVGATGAWLAGLAANVELELAFLLAAGLSLAAGFGAMCLVLAGPAPREAGAVS